MKSFKLLISGAFVFALLTPVFAVGVANAQVQIDGIPVQCLIGSGEFTELESDGCDLSLQKEVSVNGGAFVDANSAAEAASATLGDSVVWRISINNESSEGSPVFGFRVSDVLPAGVTFASSSASEGAYDDSSGIWQFTLSAVSTFPVTLTLNSTATSTGTFENSAAFSQYNGETWGPYTDANASNDTDSAFVSISAAPAVLGDTTPVVLAATGSGAVESLVAGSLILTTFGVLGYSRFARSRN